MNLHEYIKILEQQGELFRIKEFVDPVLEITEITDRFVKQPGGGKALLFENTGTDFPVLTNAMGSERRICTALGVSHLDEAAMQIETLFKELTTPKQGWQHKIKLLSELGRVASWMPKQISGRGICQEMIHRNPDLSILPVLKCWPADGGRFVTLPMVHTKDPNTGHRNVGMYRMQIMDKNSTGMHWHQHKTGARHYQAYKELGQKMPIAVALGGDPAYIYSATAPLPDNIDEYILAGFLRRKKVQLVRCITQDIEVPADSDIVIEGYVDPAEDLLWEGPFGDHTGFYSLADWYPRFHVTCITHRRDAVYPATIVGIPPQEDAYLAKATERIFLVPIKLALLPEIKDMNMPETGVSHNLALIQIDKTYSGQGHKTIYSMWGAGQMMLNKILLVTDLPVNNYRELLKSVLQRVDFNTDVFFGKGPLDVLDHASSEFAFGSKLGIDATGQDLEFRIQNSEFNIAKSKFQIAGIELDVNLKLLDEEIPIAIIAISNANSTLIKEIGIALVNHPDLSVVRVFVLVNDTIDIYNLYTVSWIAFSNTDPERDIKIQNDRMVVDACLKIPGKYPFKRNWPNVVTSSEETMAVVDNKWPKLSVGAFIASPSLPFLRMKQGDGAIVEI